jgi:hypothetical protein
MKIYNSFTMEICANCIHFGDEDGFTVCFATKPPYMMTYKTDWCERYEFTERDDKKQESARRLNQGADSETAAA